MKTDFIFAIPSYDRPDNQACLAMLTKFGYSRDDIFLAVQTEKDNETYTNKYSNAAHIVYTPGSCISDNKNNILALLRKKNKTIVMFSDAVKHITRLNENGKKTRNILSRNEFECVLADIYSTMLVEKCCVAGVYPVNNAYFMKHTYTVNQILIGCMMMFKNGFPLLFDKRLKVKEDFGLSLKAIHAGYNVVRVNYISIDRNHRIKGGCKKWWSESGDSANKNACNILLTEHPRLVTKHSTRTNELRYTGKCKTVKLYGADQ